MLGYDLVRPLEDDWRDVLDKVARARGWPTSRDVAALASRVAALSEAYNDPGRARAAARDAGAARLGFSFPRDVPKAAAAVRELVATGVAPAAASLRVLDVGAGLGATTWGFARALGGVVRETQVSGGQNDPLLEVTWIDADALALELGTEIAASRLGRPGVVVRARAIVRPVGPLDDLGRFDVVLAGHLLSELDVAAAEDVRAARHADLLAGWLDRRLEPHGALVVIEPALRDRTRHLHRVRDLLVAGGATVFAPCLHAGPCPALLHPTDWCHEDLDVDLPTWLSPVARAAGLRREGLTFSYLILRKDGRRLLDAVAGPPGAARLRVVSNAIVSKGKREAYLCGELAARERARARVMRLDRDATDANGDWDRIARGDLVTIDPAPELGPTHLARVAPATAVSLAGQTPSESR